MPFPTLLSVNDWRSKTKRNPDKEAEELLTKVYEAQTLYERFDHLIALREHAQARLNDVNYKDLSSSILSVIGHILNESEETNIEKKITARRIIRDFDPYYIPWARPNPGNINNDPYALYQSIANKTEADKKSEFNQFFNNLKQNRNLLELGGRNSDSDYNFWAYRSEDDVEEKSYTKEELEQFRVIPHQGKLIKLVTSGTRDNRHLTFDYASTSKLAVKSYDTFLQASEDYSKRGIYTIHINGSIFIGRSLAPQRTSMLFDPEAILHPSYSDSYSGVPLFMAGQTEIPTGEPTMIDSASGHYLPDYEQTQNAISFLKDLEIITNYTKLPYYRPSKKGKGEVERTFSDKNYTQFEALIIDYCTLNDLDLRALTSTYLQEHALPLYTHFNRQAEINNLMHNWKKEGSTFSSPSVQTIQLNRAVERFSKFAEYTKPIKTLALLLEVQNAIDNWKEYHQTSGKTSRRTGAVNNLENIIQKQILYYRSKLLFNNLVRRFTGKIPDENITIVTDLKGKVDIDNTIKLLSTFANQNSSPSSFFQTHPNKEEDNSLQEINNLLAVMKNSENASTDELKKINENLLNFGALVPSQGEEPLKSNLGKQY